ncbi:hypothetical protein H9P43_004333 [Blastocladiella emersonii ATCC 22665]|nr:hypothetical protein H9P43_004333 [Blastocladiella emersonii ATCC 22665]
MHLQRNRVKLETKVIGWPRAFRWRGSVLPRVALPTTVMTLWAAFLYLMQTYVVAFTFPAGTVFLSITSVVIGLLLGFRTNTAYERYWEGRRLWTNLIVAVRNIARMMWVAVEEPADRDNRTEKTSALALLMTFLIGVRNHLRMEDGLCNSDGSLRHEFEGKVPGSKQFTPEARYLLSSEKMVHTDALFLLHAYIDDLLRRKTIDLPQCGQMLNLLGSLTDSVESMDRIISTPIPIAYNLHLKQSVYLYIIFLPLQLLADFKGLSILITALVAFTFIGVIEIAGEIENPFGKDDSDLPIEEFIAEIEVELGELTYTSRKELFDWDLGDDGINHGDDVAAPAPTADPTAPAAAPFPSVSSAALAAAEAALNAPLLTPRVYHSKNQRCDGLTSAGGASEQAGGTGDAEIGGGGGGHGGGGGGGAGAMDGGDG